MKKIKILLVDDHQIVRDGIRALLANVKDMDVTGEASSAQECIKKIRTVRPDLILMDISLPDQSGIDLCRLIRKEYPEMKIVMLSMHTGAEFITKSVQAGARGYLPKNTTRQELIEAIRTVHGGQEYYSSSITAPMLRGYADKSRTAPIKSEQPETNLTQREIEILRLTVQGLSNQDVANHLYISIRTVESHKNHIMQKLKLKTTAEMVMYAIKSKIVEINL